jgi:hypothetical protein
MRSLYTCPDASSGSTLPRQRSRSQNTVTRPPSAQRADQVPIGDSASRPFGLISRTIAPSVSRCATTAHAGGSLRRSGSVRFRIARIVPRRVSRYGTPSASRICPTRCTTASVKPAGLGMPSSSSSVSRSHSASTSRRRTDARAGSGPFRRDGAPEGAVRSGSFGGGLTP